MPPATTLEGLRVELSEDRTIAYLSYTPPSTGGGPTIGLDTAVVIRELREKHRLATMEEAVIGEIIDAYNNSGEGFEHVEIANSGKPMVRGQDAHLEWCIETEPHIAEDAQGRVDFYSFSALKNVNQAQLLAKLHKAVPGTDGVAVTGEAVPAPVVKDIAWTAGDNVEFNEAAGEFYSEVNGRVEIKGSVITVSRLYEVSADVDFSTGNIQFDGLVRVHGTVRDNFQVSATDGVQVDGIIEAAKVRSGGTVTAIGGVNCREKGSIDCEGDVLTRFLNNALVYCRGTVKVEKEIVNCKVFTNEILATTGQVSGGELVALTKIDIKEAGSELGVRTVLQAGRNYFLEREIDRMQEEVKASKERVKTLDGKFKGVEQLIAKLSDEKKRGVTAMLSRADEMRRQIAKLEEEIEQKKKKVYSNDAQVVIRGTIHPGVCVRIGRYEKTMTQQFDGYRRFKFDKEKYDIVAYFEEE